MYFTVFSLTLNGITSLGKSLLVKLVRDIETERITWHYLERTLWKELARYLFSLDRFMFADSATKHTQLSNVTCAC